MIYIIISILSLMLATMFQMLNQFVKYLRCDLDKTSHSSHQIDRLRRGRHLEECGKDLHE